MLMLKTMGEGVPDISILVPVDPNILDPKYAELAIMSLNKLIDLNVDIKELDREAKEVEAKIKEVLKKNREIQEAHKKAVGDDAGPSMYA
jgi:predicted ATP-grasp superfamily ATP-dependent carboligase